MVYWIHKQNTDEMNKEAAGTAGTILAHAPYPNPRGSRAATHFQAYRAVLGLNNLVFTLFGPSSTKGHSGRGHLQSRGWVLALTLGKTLWFRDKPQQMLRDSGCTHTGPAFSTDRCFPAEQSQEAVSSELTEPQNPHGGPSRDQLRHVLGKEGHCKAGATLKVPIEPRKALGGWAVH